MGYGRVGKSEPQEAPPLPETQQHDAVPLYPSPKRRRKKLVISLLFLSTILIIAASVSATLVVRNRTRGGSDSSEPLINRKPTQAISWTCGKTLYPSLCINYLLDFPGSLSAEERDLVHISVNMTLQHFGKALYITSEISNLKMDARVRSAYEDCIELLEDSVDALTRSLYSISPSSSAPSNGQQHGSTQDVLTWLSAALTNQDTCTDGLGEVSGPVKNQMEDRLRDLSELVSNCLAIFAAASGDEDFSGIPIQNKRRLMNTKADSDVVELHHEHGYPTWMTRRDRELLDMPGNAIPADIIVSQDGNGTVKTISEAIKKAPEYSSRRTIIYVKAGRYEENNLKVGRKKTNLMFVGDGKGKTVISGGKSVFDNMTTFHTASFGK
ncbi:Pectinesterase inhibitor domain [Dillenia turbinata]|uniref:pectinesterase n=1 Tax=Dillenia turbinata TaxID=194707 RepID=A0AAN8ZG17_9MAGN